MRTEDLGPELAADIRLVAAYYNMSPAKYIRTALQKAVDEVCDFNPIVAEAVKWRR